MKSIIILIISFVVVGSATAQDNILTVSEFNAVQLNKKTFAQVWATKGVEVAFQNLFGAAANSIERRNEDFPAFLGVTYNYSDFTLTFGTALSQDNSTLKPVNFKLTKSSASLRIKGKTCHIGDNISVLGNVSINTLANGDKGISFASEEINKIYIRYDQKTKIITEIGYYVLT